MNEYAIEYGGCQTAATATADARISFIRRTYLHLTGAILAFVALETVLIGVFPNLGEKMLDFLVVHPFGWLLVLAAFIGVSFLARSWAHQDVSEGMQYFGLGLYVLAEVLIFLPILLFAELYFPDQHIIGKAAILTLTVFGGLSLAVFVTGHDFSFLRTALVVGSFALFGVILAAVIFGGFGGASIFIAFAGVALACGFILYTTSNVLHHYQTNQHVGAALELFAAVALLFWYILQIVMSSSRD